MALITDIADAVAAELNAAAGELITGGFTAERHYRPAFDLREMNALRVSVVPRGVAITPLDRQANQHDVQIDVAVQRKVDEADPASLDELMGLVERIGDLFRHRRLDGLPKAVWVKTENKPVYSAEHLEQYRQFTSVLTFTFRASQ